MTTHDEHSAFIKTPQRLVVVAQRIQPVGRVEFGAAAAPLKEPAAPAAKK